MTVVNSSDTTPAPAPNSKFSPELATLMRLQERMLNEEALSSDEQKVLGILAALMDGADLPVIDITALANMAARLNAAQKARDVATAVKSEISAVVLDAGVRTDHILAELPVAVGLAVSPTVLG